MSRSIVRAIGMPAVAVLGTVGLAAAPAGANQNNGGNQPPNGYVQHNLVSDVDGMADLTDASLVNPWGLAQGPVTPAWVADNGTNVATLYRGDGVVGPLQKVPLTVNVPGDGVTGQVFNSTPGFVVNDGHGHSGPALFIFDSESGDITGWNPAVPPATPPAVASTQAQNGVHVAGAIYKGLALATVGSDSFLYAANFHAGTVDVFDSTFTQVKLDGTFKDPHLPKHYAPFGIALINGNLYVSYAVQDAAAEDEVDGFGRGIVDVFDTSGHFVHRLISFGHLDAPWGMTIAPDDFGKFSGDLLVGNFGNGRIHAYDAQTGRFKGTVKDDNQKPIVIDGLWGLMVGNGVSAAQNAILFSAGIDHEQHGLYGTVAAG
jgi:uncharacterized protein (TIGR03118 family)